MQASAGFAMSFIGVMFDSEKSGAMYSTVQTNTDKATNLMGTTNMYT